LVLERGVAVAVRISFVPDGAIEFPEEVNMLANPNSSREHGQNKHPYVYPLLVSLTDNAEKVYQTLRVFMQAVLFCPETTDHKLKRSSNNTIGVVGLVVNFDHQKDHVDEANIGANLLKVVHTFIKYANNLARRPFNGEASETFQFPNEFREGTNYTRANPHRRHLGQVISPKDSVAYMECIFEGMTFDQLVCDRDIIEGMYGSVNEGNALVAIARPNFVPLSDTNDGHRDKDNLHEDEIPPFVADP
jgi:hypothetical protein